ncbi:hypothetical protein [Brevibacillus daliensis]|nr:hypothetical protein [Brevibacillus daliensis]
MKKFLAIAFTVMMVMSISGAASATSPDDNLICPNPKYPNLCLIN